MLTCQSTTSVVELLAGCQFFVAKINLSARGSHDDDDDDVLIAKCGLLG